MKAKQIWIIVGVIALILIIANWDKIFGQSEKKGLGGGVARPNPVQGPLIGKSRGCRSSLDCKGAEKCNNGRCTV